VGAHRAGIRGGFHERNTSDHLRRGIGYRRNHSVLRRRDADDARKYEAGLPKSDCLNRNLVGDWRVAGLGSGAGIACRTDSAELAEQSKHRQIMLSGNINA
jgi:hypothetical protein